MQEEFNWCAQPEATASTSRRASRPPLLEISNESDRTPQSRRRAPSPVPSPYTLSPIMTHSSHASTSSYGTVAESPVLWFSPGNSPVQNNGEWSTLPTQYSASRKGKERAVSAPISRDGKRQVDLESCLGSEQLGRSHGPNLSPSSAGLGIGVEDYDFEAEAKAEQESYSSLFRRRYRIDQTRTLPTVATASDHIPLHHGTPNSTSSSISFASTSSSSSGPTSANTPSFIFPITSLFGNKQSDQSYTTRLRALSSPKRRRKRDSTIVTLSENLPLLRSAHGLIGLLLIAGTFMLLGFTFGPSRMREDVLSRSKANPSSKFRLSLSSIFPFLPLSPALPTTSNIVTDNFREAPHRDTLILYRILGNDLPPRHELGQTLRNLRFMLERESSFSTLQLLADSNLSGIRKVDKYFVLNRISSIETLNAIRALLTEFRVPQDRILTIPFEWSEYERRSIRWDGGVAEVAGVWNIGRPGDRLEEMTASENQTLADVARAEADNLTGKAADKRKSAQNIGRLRAVDFTYHDKNLYAINNNGGRNFALQHGRSLPHARWILPLDGNCFFTPPAMLSLVNNLEKLGEGENTKTYVVIPMARLLDNAAILPVNKDLRDDLASRTSSQQALLLDGMASMSPEAPEEPQIGFRFDATESYQLGMRYGRRSKLEFLWRLGVVPRSRNLDRRTLPWEQSDREHLTSQSFASVRKRVNGVDHVGFMHAGWVYRLFSGHHNQEVVTKEANSLRNMNRIRGIVGFLEKLDEKITRGQMCRGLVQCGFNRRLTWTWNLEDLDRLKEQYRIQEPGIQMRIDDMRREAMTVQDELHLAMKIAPATLGYVDPTEAARNISTMALAGYLSNSQELIHSAAQLVLARFLAHPGSMLSSPPGLANVTGNGLGYTFPLLPPADSPPPLWMELLQAEVTMPYDAAKFDPTELLDAFRLIEAMKSNLIPHQAEQLFASGHLAYLMSNPNQLRLSQAPSSPDLAANYDIQVAALAAFVDDVRLLNRVKSRSLLRSRHQRMDHVLEEGLANVRALELVSEDFVSQNNLLMLQP